MASLNPSIDHRLRNTEKGRMMLKPLLPMFYFMSCNLAHSCGKPEELQEGFKEEIFLSCSGEQS